MSTLALESQPDYNGKSYLLEQMRNIMKVVSFKKNCEQIAELVHHEVEVNYWRLAEFQRKALADGEHHVEYSLKVHEDSFDQGLAKINDNDTDAKKNYEIKAREGLAKEILAIFDHWPTFSGAVENC